MDNQDIIKLFLQNEEVRKYIQTNNWDHIYNSPDKRTSVNFLWNHPDSEDDVIGEFTCMLLNSGIDPLKHMKNIPEAYLRGINFESMLDTNMFEIPENIVEVSGAAFNGCKNLNKIIIPISVKKICQDAFVDNEIEEIEYKGFILDWRKIELEGNPFFDNPGDGLLIHCIDGDLYQN